MNNTPTWLDYLLHNEDDDDLFQAQFPAHALAEDLVTVVGPATVEVLVTTDDDPMTVMVAFFIPDAYDDMWFDADNAHTYAAAMAAAVATPEPTTVELTAWSNEAIPEREPVPVTIATDPQEPDGVYLALNAGTDSQTHGRSKIVLGGR